MMAKNLRMTGTPLGLSSHKVNTWWHGLEIKKEGGALLFTGLLYQLTPYIVQVTKRLYGLENTPLEGLVSASGILPSYMIGGFLKPKSADIEQFNSIIRKISLILSKSGVDFSYNPELDFYSGALLYDLGCDEAFEEHARYVAGKLEKRGIKRLITIDPHTTYTMKVLYPEYAGAEFQVINYLDLIQPKAKGDAEVTIHDPCYYARYLDIYDQPREVLKALGMHCVDVKNSKKMTYCCGAPIESISPKLSKEIARVRFTELKETGCEVVTMCPLCLANLKDFGDVKDISEVIWRACHD